jgi:hypothetical protein
MNDGCEIRSVEASLVRLAVRAPSSHNTQPWRFRISAGIIDVLADRERALAINDPDDRELTISCGCALATLRIAASGRGRSADVTLFPNPANPNWLARVSLEAHASSHSSGADLAEQIEKRATYRKAFAHKPVPDLVCEDLVRAAGIEGASLRPIVKQHDRSRLADLVMMGDSAQWSNRAWRSELAAWMRPRWTGDGLTVVALAAPLAQFVVRALNLGASVGASSRRLAAESPLVMILGTEGDSLQDWLSAGQALQHVLLTACKFGLQASYLNQPVQVPSLRLKLREVVSNGYPQIVLRLGYPAGTVRAAPRRSLESVLEA